MITLRLSRTESYTRAGLMGPLRPYVAVRIQHGGRFNDTLGLIDSGADNSLFHRQFALILGIDLSGVTKERTAGIGGGADVWYYDVFLTVSAKRFPARVGFSDQAPTQFGLLGRDDFFRAFQIAFDQAKTQVHLHPAPP